MVVALSLLASFMPNTTTTTTEVEQVTQAPLHVQIILPVAVVMFSLCYGAGFGPAIYTWSSELLPPR